MNRRNFIARLTAAFAGIGALFHLPQKAKPIVVQSPKTIPITGSVLFGLYSKLSTHDPEEFSWWERDPLPRTLKIPEKIPDKLTLS